MTHQHQNNVATAAINRLPDVLTSNGHVQARKKATQAAESLSRRNVYIARAKLMQQALAQFVDLCYESIDGAGINLVNVDPDNRIAVAVPWGRLHFRDYGLRYTEREMLRWAMIHRTRIADHVPLVVLHDRRWYLNRSTYPTKADATAYLESYPVTWKTVHRWNETQR